VKSPVKFVIACFGPRTQLDACLNMPKQQAKDRPRDCVGNETIPASAFGIGTGSTIAGWLVLVGDADDGRPWSIVRRKCGGCEMRPGRKKKRESSMKCHRICFKPWKHRWIRRGNSPHLYVYMRWNGVMCLHRQSPKLVFLESVFEWHILLEKERGPTSRMSSYDS